MANAVKENPKKVRSSGLPSGIADAGIGTVHSSGTLTWYKMTEQTRYVLNNAIAKYVHERLEERNKEQPDPVIINRLTRKINQIVKITRNPANFQSIHIMRQLVEQYGQ